VVKVGTSRAVVIPSQVFESLASKGKTFSKVYIYLNGENEIIIRPVLIDIAEGK
jgi:antitoxin component of MazEF toxin-antitoxin module